MNYAFGEIFPGFKTMGNGPFPYLFHSPGYGLPYKLAVPLGSLYVNVLIDRLTGASNTKTDLWQEFGHDTTIDLALSALGLAKDTPNIPAKGPVNPDRAWRTSTQGGPSILSDAGSVSD
jgi:hypothetical protein